MHPSVLHDFEKYSAGKSMKVNIRPVIKNMGQVKLLLNCAVFEYSYDAILAPPLLNSLLFSY